MQVVQSVIGVFHHFELAHQLHSRGHLRRLYSTWPWARLKREGLPHSLVSTFPWIHTADFLLARHLNAYPRSLSAQVRRLNLLAFDRYTHTFIPPCDAFIAISGTGLLTGQLVQQRGGVFICDRGSTHQRFQLDLLAQEYERWNIPFPQETRLAIAREEVIYAVADAITVPSEISKRSFLSMGVPAEKVHVIPYGVRLDRFSKHADPPRDSFDVLFAGQASLRKGIPYLLLAFAALKHPKKRLRLAGHVTPDLRAVLPRLPQGTNVEFLGSLSPTELVEVMNRSHVLVLPSIEDGYGLVVPQAMACGCPILASSDVGGCEILTQEVDGFITKTRDVAAMTDRLQQLADDPELQQRMGAAALDRVRNIGGWDEYGSRWDHLLHQLTGLPPDEPA